MADIGYDGKVAIITGAGGGLGREHALELAQRGARIVVNDLGGSVSGEGGDKGPAEHVADEINDLGGEAVADTNSVATAEGGEAIVKTAVDAFGTVDIVINNAGILRDKTFHNMTTDLVEPVIQVHLLGAFYVTHPGVADHAREGLRPRHQHLVELRPARQLRPVELRRRQDGPRRVHPRARQRGAQAQHQGQRHRPGGQDPHDRGAARRRRPTSSNPRRSRPLVALPRVGGVRRDRRGVLGRRWRCTPASSSGSPPATTRRTRTVEDVRDHWAEIRDVDGFIIPDGPNDELKKIFGILSEGKEGKVGPDGTVA